MESRGRERRSSARRQHRRDEEHRRPAKRLFTPEIKRYLKDWLIRRRDNPYPSRDEKKSLAVQTGLTYVQVCNWFANWRRKLKNAGKEPQRTTWGHLIRAYNSQAHGNVEHFSICSDDSIWEEPQQRAVTATVDHCYSTSDSPPPSTSNGLARSNNKYKSNMMEKYLRDLTLSPEVRAVREDTEVDDKPKILSKWLQSAANFRPRRENYVGWERISHYRGKERGKHVANQKHGREELDAAEALTRLASAT